MKIVFCPIGLDENAKNGEKEKSSLFFNLDFDIVCGNYNYFLTHYFSKFFVVVPVGNTPN